MFGAVYGDIIGSFYEFHSTKKRDFSFQFLSRFTDDTVLTTAVCEAILDRPEEIPNSGLHDRALEYAALFRRYYRRYPHAGYGGMFIRWAKGESFDSVNSFGNGAAMRVVPIGWAYPTLEQTMLQAKASCLITHHHPEAIHGAQAVAAAVFLARNGCDKAEIRAYIEWEFGYSFQLTLDEIRPTYSFTSRSSESVPQAIEAFLESVDYESAIRNAISLGGDADTMACIAGGIAQAYYHMIPDEIRRFCDHRLDSSLRLKIREFENKYSSLSQ